MTLTAIRPPLGLSKGRETALLSVSQASALISFLYVTRSFLFLFTQQKLHGCAIPNILCQEASLFAQAMRSISFHAEHNTVSRY